MNTISSVTTKADQLQKPGPMSKLTKVYGEFSEKEVVIPDVAARPKEDSAVISDAAKAKEAAERRVGETLDGR